MRIAGRPAQKSLLADVCLKVIVRLPSLIALGRASVNTATGQRSSSNANGGNRFGQAVPFTSTGSLARVKWFRGRSADRCCDQVAATVGRDGSVRQFAPLGPRLRSSGIWACERPNPARMNDRSIRFDSAVTENLLSLPTSANYASSRVTGSLRKPRSWRRSARTGLPANLIRG